MKKIFRIIIFIVFAFTFTIFKVNATRYISPDDVPRSSYIIGTHLLTNPQNEILDTSGNPNAIFDESAVIYTHTIMFASRSISESEYSDIVFYYKNRRGNWEEATNGSSISNLPSQFEITHVNGICIDDPCPEPGSGGGDTGETVKITFKDGNTTLAATRISKGSVLAIDSLITSISNTSKEGYYIDYWTTNDDNQFNFNTPITEDIYLYAHYVPIRFNINYDLVLDGAHFENGTTEMSKLCDLGSNATNCTIINDRPVRDGYIFKGWSIKEESSDTNPLISGGVQATSLLIPSLTESNNVTLYAVWEPERLSIKYILNGGQIYAGELQAKFTILDTIDVDNIRPVREGYSFRGWSTVQNDLPNLENKVVTISETYQSKILYAQWEPIKFNINFDKDGETIYTKSGCEYDSCFVSLPNNINYQKAGYNFKYFKDESNYIYRIGEPIRSTRDVTLTAVYDDGIFYNINYDFDNGSITGNLASQYKMGSGNVYELPAPSKIGYSFKEWKVESGNAEIVEGTNNSVSITGPDAISLKAYYTQDEYTVTYRYKDEHGEWREYVSSEHCKYDSVCNIGYDAPEYDGFSVKYWLGSDLKQYGQNTNTSTLSYNLTLDAVYGNEQGFYDIKYYDSVDDLSANPPVEMPTSYFKDSYITRYSSEYAFNLPIPKKTGYRFDGWMNGDTYLGNYLPIGTINDISLVAKWTPLRISVSYDLNFEGAPTVESKNCNLTDAACYVQRSVSDDTRPGYRFLGWSMTDGSSQLLDSHSDLASILEDANEDGVTTVTLYAIWETKQYPVIYDLQGGHFKNSDLENITYYTNLDSKTINFAVPEREGYNPNGWTVSYADYENGTTASANLDTASEGKVVIKANWTPKALNVSFTSNGFNYTNVEFTGDCNYEGCNFTTGTPVKDGTTFKYWKDSTRGLVFGTTGRIEKMEGSVALVAVFDDTVSFNISYDYDRGGLPSNDYIAINEYVEGVGTNLPVPIRTGYDFKGWKVDGTDDVIWSIPATYSGDKSLTAQWDKKTYKISYIDLESQATVDAQFGSTITLPTPASPYDYHTFRNWLVAHTNGTTYSGGQQVVVNGDMAFIAQYDIVTQYSIGYDLNGGTYVGSLPSNYNRGATNIMIPSPTRDDYRFDGWEELNNKATVSNGVLTVTTQGNLELKANWLRLKYHISYNYGVGALAEGVVNPTILDARDIRAGNPIPLNEPVGDYYEFNGWTVDSGNARIEGGSLIFEDPDNPTDVVLTAQWEPKEFTVHFINSYDSTFDESVVCTFGVVCDISSVATPTYANHTFSYWISSELGVIYSDTRIYALDDMTLEAAFIGNPVNITYDLDGGEVLLNQTLQPTVNYGDDINLPSGEILSKEHYEFVGWYDITDPDQTIIDQIENVTEAITVKAKWRQVVFSITYDYAGGALSANVTNPDSYNAGDTNVTINSPSRDGYSFKKWTSNVSTITVTSKKLRFPTGGEQDVILTANWNPRTVNLVYYEDNAGTIEINDTGYSGQVSYQSAVVLPEYPQDLLEFDDIFVYWLYNGHALFPGDQLIWDGYESPVEIKPYIIKGVTNDQIYHINYVTNDGGATSTSGLVDRFYANDVFNLASISRDGYEFLGWSTDLEGTNIVQSVSGLSAYAVDNIVTLYAQWNDRAYSLRILDDNNQVVHTIPVLNGIGVKMLHGPAFEEYELIPNVDGKTLVFIPYDYADGSNYYLASGWQLASDSSVTYPYNYDFGSMSPGGDVVEIKPIINTNDVFVNINQKEYFVDQAGNPHSGGGIAPVTYLYGDTIEIDEQAGRTMYGAIASAPNPFLPQNALSGNVVVGDGRINLETTTTPNYPQITLEGTIYDVDDEIHTIDSYQVMFLVDNEVYGGSSFTCSFADEYCDFSNLGIPTKSGYTFLGWETENSEAMLDENMHLYYDNIGEEYISFVAEWQINSFTVNLYDGNDMLLGTYPVTSSGTLSVMHGPGFSEIIADAFDGEIYISTPYDYELEGNYYLASRWENMDNSNLSYPYDFNLAEIVTDQPVLNLKALVNVDDEFVNLETRGYYKDQENNIHSGGELAPYPYLYGSSYFDCNEDSTCYGDSGFTREIENGDAIDEDNIDLESVTISHYPQITRKGTVHQIANDIEFLTEYYLSFQDNNHEIYYVNCSFADDYCDLSSVPQPTKDGFVFAGWESNVSGFEFAEQFPNPGLAYDYIEFSAVWVDDGFTLNFFNIGRNDVVASKEITPDMEHYYAWGGSGEPDEDLISGWTNDPLGDEVIYDFFYDFANYPAVEEEENLFPVVREEDDFVVFDNRVEYFSSDGTPLNRWWTNPYTQIMGSYFNKEIMDFTFGEGASEVEYYLDPDYMVPVSFNYPIDDTSIIMQYSETLPSGNEVYTSNLYIKVYVDEYNVVFNDENGNLIETRTCSYDDDYCDLSNINLHSPSTGRVFAYWEADIDGIEYNEHFVYNDKTHKTITFTPVFALKNYTINFNDEDGTFLESKMFTYGTPDTGWYLSDGTPVVRNENGDMRYYQMSGWATEQGSSEIVYDYKDDLGSIVATESVFDLYAVVDENASVVEVQYLIKDVNGEGLPLNGVGYGEGFTVMYGDTLSSLANSYNSKIDSEWYYDPELTQPIDLSKPITDSNWRLESFFEPMMPQVDRKLVVYIKGDVVQSKSNYTINFYDTDHTTLLKTKNINYNSGHYYGYNGKDMQVGDGITGWTLDSSEYVTGTIDYLFDFTKFVTTQDNINLYATRDTSQSFVGIQYYYVIKDTSGAQVGGSSDAIEFKYGEVIDKNILDNLFSSDAEYYTDARYRLEFSFDRALDKSNYQLEEVSDPQNPLVNWNFEIYVKRTVPAGSM